MPLTADQDTLARITALLTPATDASIDAEELEVGAALTGLAISARLLNPKAKYVVLGDSDQGSWAWVNAVEDAHGEELDVDTLEVDGDMMWSCHLYDNRRHVASPYVAEDKDSIDRRNPWEGVSIDIDKVLANPPQMPPLFPSITIPDGAWREAGEADPGDDDEHRGDARSRLTTTISINGQFLHLDAYEVAADSEPHDLQEAVQGDGELGLYAEACGADGPFDTVNIAGRPYVLVATPFS